VKKKGFISLQAMLILAEISKWGSQRKAAQSLDVSTDTIKKYISILEEEVGHKLIVSRGHGQFLTIYGKSLIRQVNDIKNIFNQIFNDKAPKENLSGEVLISMPVSVSTNLFPKDIDDFFSQYPGISLVTQLYMDNTDFSSMNTDIGLTFLPPAGIDTVILCQKTVECGYFASPQYLAKHGYPKNFDDLLNNHWLIDRVQLSTFMPEWKNVLKKSKTHTIYNKFHSLGKRNCETRRRDCNYAAALYQRRFCLP